MKWSVLIVTQPSREELLHRLLGVLEPQVAVHSNDVEILTLLTDRSLTHGAYCQQLREATQGEYSNFIDDDDLVPNDYVESVLPNLDGVDFIGHKLQRFDDGVAEYEPFEHSLRHRGSNSPHSTPHINPIRTELALQVSMSGGFGADRKWWYNLLDSGVVQTEHYIDKVLYEYYYRSNKSDGCP